MTEYTRGAGIPLADVAVAKTACPQPEEEGRGAYLDRLKAQIRSGVYRPDIRDLARSLASMIVQEL